MGAQETDPGQESERKQTGPGERSGPQWGAGEGGGRPGAVGSQRSRSPQELFSRGKNGFFSSHKVCIVAQRGALTAARGLRGRDNLGSVPPAPYTDHLPEGHKQSPAAKPLPLRVRPPALRLLTNTKSSGAQARSLELRGAGSQGCSVPRQRSGL